MKKYILIISSIVLFIIFYWYYKTVKENYTENFEKMLFMLDRYYQPYEWHIVHTENFQYPINDEEIFLSFINQYELEDYLKQYYIDFLSKKSKGIVHYIPLFNPDNLKIESYVILSAGIDGKINNNYNWKDTLFITDFMKKLKLYNPYDFNKYVDTFDIDKKYKFNLLDCLFGRKDYFIAYGYKPIDYLRFRVGFYSFFDFDDLIKRNFFPSIYKKYISIMPYDTMIGKDKFIYFHYKDYLIRSKVYDGENIDISDTIILKGLLLNVDKENKIIDFIKCLQIKEEILPNVDIIFNDENIEVSDMEIVKFIEIE